MSSGSIRRLLIIWQIGALLLLGITASALAFGLASNSFNALRDLELTQIANAIARHGIEDESSEVSLDDNPGDFLSQVWEDDGSISYASHTPPIPKPERMGNYNLVYADKIWHAHSQNYGGLVIVVAREKGARVWLLRDLSLPLLILLGALTLVLTLLSWRLTGYAFAPVSLLRNELLRRDVESLEPLPTESQPQELKPLVITLNHLLGRIDGLLNAQREFVADAAHELRTPIAAVRLYAQLAERAQDRTEQLSAIRSVQESCIRATHLVEQLLALARLEPEKTRLAENVDLAAIAREIVGAHSAQAEARDIDLGIAEAAVVLTPGVPEELRMLLNNLVDNAVRYTPSGGRVDVSILRDQDCAEIYVEDTGPGIPEAMQEKVFERFHRLAGPDQPGSGLGLAIVRRIAERHGAHVTLANRNGGGLRVRVRLPCTAD